MIRKRFCLLATALQLLASGAVAEHLPTTDPVQGYVYPFICPDTDVPQRIDLPERTIPSALAGEHVIVHAAWGPDATPTDAAGNFLYTTDNPHFDEVQIFFYAEQFLGYYLPLRGYQGLGRKLICHALSDSGVDFRLDTRQCYFASPPPSRSKVSSDEIVHEIGHAVLDGFGARYPAYTPGQDNPPLEEEQAALWEAIGDYFATSYKNYPVFLNCGSCPGGDLRTVDNSYTYSQFDHINMCTGTGLHDPHANGLILAGALWAVRQQLGAEVTDRLVLGAMPYCAGVIPDFGCFANAVLQADVDRYAGAHVSTVAGIFNARDIDAAVGASILTATPVLAPGQAGSFQADFHCGGATTDLQWWKRCTVCPNATLCQPGEAWEEILLGGTEVTTSSNTDFDIRMTWTDWDGSAREAIRNIRVHGGLAYEIGGDGSVEQGSTPTYTADITEGRPPFSYMWTGHFCDAENICGNVSLGSDDRVTLVPAQTQRAFKIMLRVSDADCQTGLTKSRDITVSSSVGGDPGGGMGGGGPEPVMASRAGALLVDGGGATVMFEGLREGPVRISAYDLAGRRVARVWEGILGPGIHRVAWDTSALRGSVYFYRLVGDGGTRTQAFVIIH